MRTPSADPASVSRPAIELTNFTVSFEERRILAGLDLSVPKGQFCVIVGQSGEGKTTLLRSIAGLIPFDGERLCRGVVRMVFQDSLLLPWMTVESNVALGIRRRTLGAGRESQARAVEIMGELGIDHLRGRRPYEISGGEKQRVAFARAFASAPGIVCCDEPFGQLDVLTREHLQAWLLSFWERHKATIVFCTHDLEEALLLGDVIYVLKDGNLGRRHRVEFERPRRVELKYSAEFQSIVKRIRDELVAGTKLQDD